MKHLIASVIAGACLWVASAAGAAELTLFNVDLRSAEETTLHDAAVAAGARLVRSGNGHRVYDASRIGLPGAQMLEVLFDGGRFVIAAYSFRHDSKADHELRRLLVAKYGEAKVTVGSGKRYPLDLTERYAECGSCSWDMDPPLELVYTNLARNPRKTGLFDDLQTRLTYVNRPLFEELQRRTVEAAKNGDRERASRLGSLF